MLGIHADPTGWSIGRRGRAVGATYGPRMAHEMSEERSVGFTHALRGPWPAHRQGHTYKRPGALLHMCTRARDSR